MKPNQLAAVLVFAVLGTSALAQVVVKDPWVRATVDHQKTTGAFMQIQSTRDTRLIEVRSPAARMVEVHEMSMDNNIMRMRVTPGINLAAGELLELKPAGNHLMLMDLTGQIRPGDTVPITLVFEGKDGKRETMDVKVPVRALNTSAKPAAHGDHKH